MVRMRERNNLLKPAIPFLFLYDAVGNQAVDGSFMTWDTIKIKTSHFIYTADDDKIQLAINSSGFFNLTFEASLSGSAVTYFYVYKNGVVVNESKGYATFADGVNIHLPIYLQKDDYIQIKGHAYSGSGDTVAYTSRLIMQYIPMAGWDNNKGGRKHFIGGVVR